MHAAKDHLTFLIKTLSDGTNFACRVKGGVVLCDAVSAGAFQTIKKTKFSNFLSAGPASGGVGFS